MFSRAQVALPALSASGSKRACRNRAHCFGRVGKMSCSIVSVGDAFMHLSLLFRQDVNLDG